MVFQWFPMVANHWSDDGMAVCDETQNLNETSSETFFRYKIFLETGSETFSVPIFFETDSETFFGTNFFRNRFLDFFRYQIFSRPVPRLFSVPNFFETGSDTIKKIEEFPGTGIPGELSQNIGSTGNRRNQK